MSFEERIQNEIDHTFDSGLFNHPEDKIIAVNNLKSLFREMMVEVIGEKEDISDPNFDVVYYDSEKSPRNTLRDEQIKRMEKLLGEK